MPPASQSLSVIVPTATVHALDRVAGKEHRKRADQLRVAIDDHLRARGLEQDDNGRWIEAERE